MLANEASLNSSAFIQNFVSRVTVEKDMLASLKPLFEDSDVGQWLRDPTSDAIVRVLFKLPEDGDDEALWVTGELREPGLIYSGGLRPAKYPCWNVSEFDASDMKKARDLTRQNPNAVTPPTIAIELPPTLAVEFPASSPAPASDKQVSTVPDTGGPPSPAV